MDGIRREKMKGAGGRALALLLCLAVLCGQLGITLPTFAMAAEPASEITVELEVQNAEQPIVDEEPASEPAPESDAVVE